jgi:Domain of unknown function (DUF4440)
MSNDIAGLRTLNVEIGEAETSGNRQRLDEILVPTFAFQRADGTFDDRKAFLEKVNVSSRRITEIESIAFYGKRAVVSCIVTMNGARFHNLRLFIKQGDEWKLLGWANERLEDTSQQDQG